MNILADENVARLIVDRLRKEGHTVQYIYDIARGSVDIDILERANRENALLLTGHPEICHLAEVLLTELTGLPIQQHCECGETPQCCFVVPAT